MRRTLSLATMFERSALDAQRWPSLLLAIVANTQKQCTFITCRLPLWGCKGAHQGAILFSSTLATKQDALGDVIRLSRMTIAEVVVLLM